MRRAGLGCLSEATPPRSGRTRFPRQARLLEPAEFKRVFDHCHCKAANRWMTVLAVANDGAGARLGLVVSRKTARTAVARNRVKRLIRESFRLARTELGNLDIVVIGRPGIALQGNRALARALETLWKKLIKTCAAC